MHEDRQLPDSLHEQLQALCANGDKLAEAERYSEALVHYQAAWKLLPEPQNDWEAATWVLAAIADALFLSGQFQEARATLEYAMTCPDALGNPFLHLRLGQVLFETGNDDQAADQLMRAYMGAGEEIFAHDDPRYLQFLATRAKL
ncbi:tetratricopeptide repeat protein [Pseudomonas sp. Fl5BN2]|uniref:tetratricopeptide repeat protein n=1 Tax=unclassified Pseudomonas TaxID=196821 RepID=UPI001376BBD3|nr:MULTISPECIES: tetratricopeptide repeat protein [unclassified Pseudomonas]NBF01962.1 tetratricopeptide repeat protein [Pseudomonas sp. Fl5BN2]NBF08099.1 tetratricopeptide repeat protein [Pseudomonas sp. Fl4BN1]